MIEFAARPSEQSSPACAAKTGRWRSVIVGCLLPLLTGVHTASPAFSQNHEHHNQYMPAALPDGMLRYYEAHDWNPAGPHPFSAFCCDRRDCGFAKPGSVTWTPQGYRVLMPDGEVQIVPEDSPAIRTQYEPGFAHEHRHAACILPKNGAGEGWMQGISPGAVESASAYYVRCLYVGKSGQ